MDARETPEQQKSGRCAKCGREVTLSVTPVFTQFQCCDAWHPLAIAVPAPGDVLAWDEVASAMQQAAEWLHSYAHGDPLVVVPESYRRVAEVLSRASLGRLAARPTPMTDEECDRLIAALDSVAANYEGGGYGLPTHNDLARHAMRGEIRSFVHGIAHPSPAAATTDHHDTRET
jgi:hypothetical protein